MPFLSLRRQRGMTSMQTVIAVAVGTIGLVLAIVMLVQYSIASYGTRDTSKDPSMSPEVVAERLKPVGQIVMFDPNAPQPAAAAAAAAPAAPVATAVAGAAAGDKGEATFKAVCSACHGGGVMGAPKFGDKAAWAPRIAKGIDSLYTSALKGKNAMPPKGGSAAPDEDIKAAVQYMVAAAK